MDETPITRPVFIGNAEDLAHFMELASTPTQSAERGDALRKWQDYKLAREVADARSRGGQFAKRKLLRNMRRTIDLRGAWLDGMCVGTADLSGVQLDGASLRGCWMFRADFHNASLRGADFSPLEGSGIPGGRAWGESRLCNANFFNAHLEGANLTGAWLGGANLHDAHLDDAILRGADLSEADLVNASLRKADLCGATVYGVSAWDVDMEGAIQSDLVITPPGMDARVTAPNIAIAQFIYLLFEHPQIGEVINTIGNQAVLILGRFTDRMDVLNALSGEVRRCGYLPIVFSFERPQDCNFTETVMVLAGLSRFIIADITAPRSVPLEMQAIIPNFMIPFVPILQKGGEEPFSMFRDLSQKDWVLTLLKYGSIDELKMVFEEAIVKPANEKREILRKLKAEEPQSRDAKDYLPRRQPV